MCMTEFCGSSDYCNKCVNNPNIEWAKKIQKEIESYDEDLKYFLGSTGDLQNERPKGVEFEVEIKTKTKLLWFQNWNKKTVKIDLKTELLGREVFTCIEDLIIRKRDKEIAFLNKVEAKIFVGKIVTTLEVLLVKIKYVRIVMSLSLKVVL